VKRRIVVALVLVGLLCIVVVARAGAATQSESNVAWKIDDPTIGATAGAKAGTSTLTRTGSGISFSLTTTGLQAGHAVTIWMMVANPDGGVAVLYGAGHVIDDAGTAEFGGHLAVGDSDGWAMGSDTTLEDALQATVTLVVRDHGAADPDTVDDADTVSQQIHTIGACNPTCTDLQTSVHAAS
jgi:hypothetical protein